MPRETLDWKSVLGPFLTGVIPVDDNVIHLTIGKNSHVYSCTLWENIHVWANCISERSLPPQNPHGHRLAVVNYCLSGRCEVLLPADTYIYMEPGMLCVSCHVPEDGWCYPTGSYTGLEIAIDLDALRENPPEALVDYGDFSIWLEGLLSCGNGSLVSSVTDECRGLMAAMFRSLQEAGHSIGEHRFNTLGLLYRLMHGGMVPLPNAVCVTKGQRMIVSEVEERISGDLSRHFTVEELASDYGISASSLKSYFEKVHGQPISRYLKELRIDRAELLLSGTRMKVGEIAESCGYSHQGKFGEVFKEQTGMTPLEYRRRGYKRKE